MEERVAWQLALPHGDVPKSNSASEQTLRNVGHGDPRGLITDPSGYSSLWS